jgi:hypothetical protein
MRYTEHSIRSVNWAGPHCDGNARMESASVKPSRLRRIRSTILLAEADVMVRDRGRLFLEEEGYQGARRLRLTTAELPGQFAGISHVTDSISGSDVVSMV